MAITREPLCETWPSVWPFAMGYSTVGCLQAGGGGWWFVPTLGGLEVLAHLHSVEWILAASYCLERLGAFCLHGFVVVNVGLTDFMGSVSVTASSSC